LRLRQSRLFGIREILDHGAQTGSELAAWLSA
jgi:hypothetical protein